MLRLVFILMLLTSTPADARCFLFFCSLTHHHRVRHARQHHRTHHHRVIVAVKKGRASRADMPVDKTPIQPIK